MSSRLFHLRAALLLVLSSALVFWVVAFWFPLTDYLVFLSSDDVAKFELILKIFVAIYISLCLVNLLIAGLFATRLPKTLKFWLAIIPAAILFITPFAAAIPIAFMFPERNYFEVFQAMFRLFRFTKADTFAVAIIVILLATLLNVLAAVMVARAGEADKLPSKLRPRYLIYTLVVFIIAGSFTAANLVNASYRDLDRKSCQQYSLRELPALDEDVPSFLSDLMLYGQSAGTRFMQDSFVTFSMVSRQYYAALSQDADPQTLSQLEYNVAQSKQTVTDLCSEFGPETKTPTAE